MSAAQRDKGARAEREVAAIFQAAGFDCHRVPNSGGLRIKGDLYGDVPAHVESKFQATIRLPQWWRQTRGEAPEGVLPLLAVKLTGVNRHRPKEWVAVVPLKSLVALLAELGLARCAGCFKVSGPRPLGQTPDGWMRGESKPGDHPQGCYWCPECVASAGWKRV